MECGHEYRRNDTSEQFVTLLAELRHGGFMHQIRTFRVSRF
jgi:hypothetical protein